MKKMILFLLSSVGMAQASVPLLWMQSSTINGFNQAIAGVSAQTKVPVIFPEFVPAASGVTYYMHFDTFQNLAKGYNLYIDSADDCNGAHYCNILSLNASTQGSLQIQKNIQGQIMTVAAVLNNGQQGNYTQGFAKGDYWNPNFVWQQNGITYTLTWQGIANADQTRKAVMTMANVLQSLPVSANS